jgi:hypothetical protein
VWSAMPGRRCCGSWPTGWADQRAWLAWPGPAPASGRGGAAGPGGDAGRRRRLPERPGGAAGPAELFGPVASTPTAWRVHRTGRHDPDGLARLRAARAHARARAWAAGGHPDGAAGRGRGRDLGAGPQRRQGRARQGTYKHTFGFARCWPTWTAARRPASRWRPAATGQRRPGAAMT